MKSEYVDRDGFVLGSTPAHDGVYNGFRVLLTYATKRGEDAVELGIDAGTHEVGERRLTAVLVTLFRIWIGQETGQDVRGAA